ncbi:hypothetical protein PGT21_024131 [Puccinia graminis f. sp. tritici]|uniref:Uncharacterized protein n=1 Tax=Puccinia graminis f. sp. tritici TaxID=56615 RepID=A0A5B0MUI0_PUCGR|nr:hypothetical protein PGT21_024131 [Puccinia graminis f. sp. tritici]
MRFLIAGIFVGLMVVCTGVFAAPLNSAPIEAMTKSSLVPSGQILWSPFRDGTGRQPTDHTVLGAFHAAFGGPLGGW